MCGLPYKVRSGHPSPYGSVIRGQGRRVDVAVLPGGQPLLFWNANGKTFQEVRRIKIFRALEEAKRDRLFGVHSVIVFGGEGWTQEVEQWAMGEGMSREEWFEAWIRRFFCSKRRLFWPGGQTLKGRCPSLDPAPQVGGKRWLGAILRALYAPHRHLLWVEPFVGGLGGASSRPISEPFYRKPQGRSDLC